MECFSERERYELRVANKMVVSIAEAAFLLEELAPEPPEVVE
jgi:hypothetical protein